MAKRGRPQIPKVAPHESLTGKCKRCRKYHTKNEHRFHGYDAYKETHKRRR